MTARDLITRSMKLIGALNPGETPSGEEAADFLVVLNDLIDGWNAERLNLYTVTASVFSLAFGKQTYQIGAGAADFNTARPIEIQSASIILPGSSVRNPLDICSSVEWAAIPERGISGELPRKLYCDYAYPLANLNISPKPTGTPQLELFAWTGLPLIVTIDDVIALPPAYSKAYRYNLGVNIASELGIPMDPLIGQIALGEKNVLRQFNALQLTGAVGQATTGQIPNVGMPQPEMPRAA